MEKGEREGKVIEVVRPPSLKSAKLRDRDLPPLLCPPSDIRGHSIKLKSQSACSALDNGRKSSFPRFMYFRWLRSRPAQCRSLWINVTYRRHGKR